MMNQIQAEVRLYYTGRSDWDTEYFTAITNTDLMNQAAAIAKQNRADHFNFGRATEEDTRPQRSAPRKTLKGLGSSPADQVRAIEGFLGLGTEHT